MAGRSFKIGQKVDAQICGEWCRGTITSRSYKNQTVEVKIKKRYYNFNMSSFA